MLRGTVRKRVRVRDAAHIEVLEIQTEREDNHVRLGTRCDVVHCAPYRVSCSVKVS